MILKKMIKIVAIRRHILALKCTKLNFGWSSSPDPARAQHSPGLMLDLRGLTFKTKEIMKEKKIKMGRKGKGKGEVEGKKRAEGGERDEKVRRGGRK